MGRSSGSMRGAGGVRYADLPYWDLKRHGGAKGDGSDATAAFQEVGAKMAAKAPYVGTLYVPPGEYLLSGSGTELVLLQHAAQLLGAGMRSTVIKVAASVGATVDVIRYAPIADYRSEYGFRVADLTIEPVSGTPARHGINLDVVAGRFVGRANFERVWIGANTTSYFGGRAIEASGGSLIAQGVPFTSTIKGCQIYGGIRMIDGGDSVNVWDTVFSGPNVAIEAELKSGAGELLAMGCNCTSAGGFLWLKEGNHCFVAFNNLEQLAAFAGGSGNNAVVDLEGQSSNRLKMPEVVHNHVGVLAGITGDGIRLGYTDEAQVMNNTYNLVESGSRGIRFTANARKTRRRANFVTAGAGQLLGDVTNDPQQLLDAPPRVYANAADSTAITNTAAETAFDKSYTIPASTLQVGDFLTIRAGGVYSTDAAGTVVNTLRLKIGGTVVGASGITYTASQTNATWRLECDVEIRTLGAPGTMRSGGGIAGATPGGTAPMVNAGAGTLNLDTTIDNAVTITTQFASARAGDSIKLGTLKVEIVSPSHVG